VVEGGLKFHHGSVFRPRAKVGTVTHFLGDVLVLCTTSRGARKIQDAASGEAVPRVPMVAPMGLDAVVAPTGKWNDSPFLALSPTICSSAFAATRCPKPQKAGPSSGASARPRPSRTGIYARRHPLVGGGSGC
jgi:hypothetical protein